MNYIQGSTSSSKLFENQISKAECKEINCFELIMIMISKKKAAVIFEVEECAFVRQESELVVAEPEALCCDSRATSSLLSSSLNCTEITEHAILNQTALEAQR